MNTRLLRPLPALLALTLPALLTAPAPAQGDPVILDSGSVFYIPFNDAQLSAFGAGPTLTMNGDVYFSAPNMRICMGTEPNIPSGCDGGISIETDFKAGFALELEADASGAFDRRLRLGTVPIYYFYFPALPSMSGSVYIDGDLVIEGEVEAGMKLGFVGQFVLDATIEFFGSVSTHLPPPKNVFFEFSQPELAGSSALDLRVAFEGGVYVAIELGGLPVSTPYAKVATGVELSVDPAVDPWWDVDAFIEPSLGWDFIFTPPLEQTWRAATWDLADAGGPFGGATVPLRWSRTYDIDDSEEVTDVKPYQGGFVAVGISHSAGNRGWIASLDADGALRWEKRSQAGTDTTMRPKEVQVTTDGGLVVGGSPSKTSGARIDRYDRLGNPLWTRGYLDGSGGTLTLESLITTSDGGLAFAGSVARPGLDSRPVVAKLDALGNPDWAVEYELDAAQNADDGHAVQLIETSDGRFLAVGDGNYQDLPQPDSNLDGRNAALLMLNGDGTFAWARALGGIGGDMGVGVTEVAGGDFVLVGHVFGEDETPWTARVDRDGVLLWSRTLAGENPGGNDRARAVVRAPSGVVVAGTSAHGPAEDGWLARLDQDGDTVWFKSFLGPNEDELMGLLRLPTGLAAWGRTRSLQPLGAGGDEDEMWIVRAPNDGMLHFDPQYGFDVHNDMRSSSRTIDIVALDLPGDLYDLTLQDDPTSLLHDLTLAIVTLLTF